MLKKKTRTEQLLENLLKANGSNVSVGHFSESGIHSDADISYPELMALHHVGTRNIPPRPILEILIDSVGKPTKVPEIRSKISKGKEALYTPESIKTMLNSIGVELANMEADIFGSSKLEANSQYTIDLKGSDKPMIDSGELRSMIGVKNSATHLIFYPIQGDVE